MKRIILFLFIVALWGCSDNSTDSGGNNDEAYSNEDVCKEGLKKTLVNGNCTAELVCQNNSWVSTSYICYEKCDKVGAEKETVVGQCITNYVCKLGQKNAIWFPVDSSCTDISTKNSSSSFLISSSSIVNLIGSVESSSNPVVISPSQNSTSSSSISASSSSFFASSSSFTDSSASADQQSGSFVDSRDGQVYKYVTIGDQVWMAENLNYKIASTITGEHSKCYEDLESNCNIYGQLYPRKSIDKLCPDGWRLPDSTEWFILFDTLDEPGKEGLALKSKNYWNGSDAYGFNALPAGYDDYMKIEGEWYHTKGAYTCFWSDSFAIVMENGDYISVFDGYDPDDPFLARFCSVRCMKN